MRCEFGPPINGDDGFWQRQARHFAPPRLPRGTGESLSWTGDAFVEACDEMIRRVRAIYRLRAHDLDDFVQDAWLTVSVDSPRDVTTRAAVVWPTGFTSLPATGPCRIFVNAGGKTGGRNCRWSAWRRPCRRIRRGCWIAIVTCKRCAARWKYSGNVFPRQLLPVFYRRQIQQCSVREVAETMRLTPQQVRVYDHRAQRKLGSILLRRRWGLTPWGGEGSGPESREGWIEAVHAET